MVTIINIFLLPSLMYGRVYCEIASYKLFCKINCVQLFDDYLNTLVMHYNGFVFSIVPTLVMLQ